MKCIYCSSTKLKKVSDTLLKLQMFECQSCGDSFDQEEIYAMKGKKSKTKRKFTKSDY